jgi:hypothetical protein
MNSVIIFWIPQRVRDLLTSSRVRDLLTSSVSISFSKLIFLHGTGSTVDLVAYITCLYKKSYLIISRALKVKTSTFGFIQKKILVATLRLVIYSPASYVEGPRFKYRPGDQLS